MKVKFQVGPTILIISSRMGDIEHASYGDGEGEFDKPYRKLMRVATQFAYEHGRRTLDALRFGEGHRPEIIAPVELRDVSSQGRSSEKLLKLSSWIDMNCKISVGCAGAIVGYMQERKIYREGGPGEGVQFQCIEVFSLKNVMWVSIRILE